LPKKIFFDTACENIFLVKFHSLLKR